MKFQYPQVQYQLQMRFVELLSNYRNPVGKMLWILARVRLAKLGAVYGLSVPPGVFGRGLSIAHIGSIVINDGVRVGRYCRIHSGTNIGVSGGQAPSIGNCVYIGPGAVVYGNARIGSGCVVAANSVVTGSYDEEMMIAGIPARPIRAVGTKSPMPDWLRQ